MNLKWSLYTAAVISFCASVTACASGRGHENLVDRMQSEVGLSVNDPSAYRNYYHNRYVTEIKLPDGNIEEEYRSVKNCRVFFTLNSDRGEIVAWRYEGSDEDCAIVP